MKDAVYDFLCEGKDRRFGLSDGRLLASITTLRKRLPAVGDVFVVRAYETFHDSCAVLDIRREARCRSIVSLDLNDPAPALKTLGIDEKTLAEQCCYDSLDQILSRRRQHWPDKPHCVVTWELLPSLGT